MDGKHCRKGRNCSLQAISPFPTVISKDLQIRKNQGLVGKGLKAINLSQRQISNTSKLKEFADDNFKIDENGRKFSKWVENTVGKREIAHYEQFLLFPQCFQKDLYS